MKKVKLGDICRIQSGGTPSRTVLEYWNNGDIPWVKISDIKKKYLNSTEEFITQKGLDHSSAKIFNKGTILYTIFATLGEVAILDIDAATNQAIAGLQIIDTRIYKDYFYFYLISLKQVVNKVGRGVAQSNINLRILREFEIPLPSWAEQKEIADRLDKIIELIEKRENQLEKLDLLIKSKFFEMFGDRLSNNKGWQTKPLSECVDFFNGKAHEQVIDNDGKFILVTSRCIASDFTDYRKTNVQLFPLKKNDIVMVMSDVPNGKAFAKCKIIDKDDTYSLNQRICCFRNYSFNSIFLLWLLNRHEYFLQFDNGDSQTNLRKNDLLACNIILPPIELQNEFARFVEQIEKLKAKIKQSHEKLTILKNSLMQKYFG